MILGTISDTAVIVIGAVLIAALAVPIAGVFRGTGMHDADALRELADASTKAQERVAEELAQLTARVGELERLLKEVG
jgi:hypothetical protein